MNIHMVEPLNNFVKLPDNSWESGWWTIDESKARELVGGEIYFHKKKGSPLSSEAPSRDIGWIRIFSSRARLLSRSVIMPPAETSEPIRTGGLKK